MQIMEHNTLLEGAAAEGLPRLLRVTVRRLRKAGTDDAALHAQLAGAAMVAIQHHQRSSLRVLIDMGLDPNQQAPIWGPEDDLERTQRTSPLHVACQYNNQKAAALLLQRGADPLAYNSNGFFTHHIAASAGDLPLLQLLLARCPAIGVDAESRIGFTALDVAARGGHIDVVKWLVGQGADVRRVSRHKFQGETVTPKLVALLSGYADVARYLEEQERAAEAAEAAARARARRHEKKKRGRARRQAATAAAAAAATAAGPGSASAAAAGTEEGDEEEWEEEDDDAMLEAVLASLGMDAGSEKQGEQAAVVEEAAAVEEVVAPAVPASAPLPDEPVLRPPPLEEFLEEDVPNDLICMISLQLMVDPIVLVGDGFTYSRASIEQHLAARRSRGLPLTSPKTNLEISPELTVVMPDEEMCAQVLEYREAKTSEWEAAEQRWRAWGAAAGQQGKGNN